MTAEPVHNKWGQYVIDGKAYQRATTLTGFLDGNPYALDSWKKRRLARGLVLRQDLLAVIASIPDDETDKVAKQQVNLICEAAVEAAAASAGANLGTAYHAMTARIDRGEDFQPMPPWDVDMKAYVDLLEQTRIGVCPEWIEKTCVVPELGVAGTFDRIVEVNDRLYIADLKTGRDLSYSWNAISVQLAVYAHADHIWDWETSTCSVMPEVDQRRALVIHLPALAGQASLYSVNIEAGWEAAQMAVWVREWRKRNDLARPARIRQEVKA